jgi:hypothetical protein
VPSPTSLDWQRLRPLTLPAQEHPRGQPHLSAASGLVCAFGRAYVVADDEHHLGVFDDARSPGHLHRLIEGDLPADAAERKARKADLETLAFVPAGALGPTEPGAALCMFGSGSAPGRDRGLWQPLDAGGGLAGGARALDLAPLYGLLRGRLGALNVEGALVVPGEGLWLFSRGGSGARGANAVVRYRWRDVRPWLLGRAAGELAPVALQVLDLGSVDGVGYGFTDAAALPDALGGGCLFTAVAEDSADSVADGTCVGSAVGRLGPGGDLRWMRPLRGAPKVEGLALHLGANGLKLCLATDADNPAVPSQLLLAHLARRDLDARSGIPKKTRHER